jgi:hypothetical protein
MSEEQRTIMPVFALFFNVFGMFAISGDQEIGVPYGIRTRVVSVKGICPRPLDEGDACGRLGFYNGCAG